MCRVIWQNYILFFVILIIYLVENIGIEPMTSCMPCKRSSQLS